jgi:transposase-like protein
MPNSGALRSSAASCEALSGSAMGMRRPCASRRAVVEVVIGHRRKVQIAHATLRHATRACESHFVIVAVDVDQAGAVVAASTTWASQIFW